MATFSSPGEFFSHDKFLQNSPSEILPPGVFTPLAGWVPQEGYLLGENSPLPIGRGGAFPLPFRGWFSPSRRGDFPVQLGPIYLAAGWHPIAANTGGRTPHPSQGAAGGEPPFGGSRFTSRGMPPQWPGTHRSGAHCLWWATPSPACVFSL